MHVIYFVARNAIQLIDHTLIDNLTTTIQPDNWWRKRSGFAAVFCSRISVIPGRWAKLIMYPKTGVLQPGADDRTVQHNEANLGAAPGFGQESRLARLTLVRSD